MNIVGLATVDLLARFMGRLARQTPAFQPSLDAVSMMSAEAAYEVLLFRYQIPETELLAAAQAEFGVSGATQFADPGIRSAFDEERLRAERWLPLFRTSAETVVAVDNPFNEKWKTVISDGPVRIVVWPRMDLTAALYAGDEPQDAVHKVLYDAIVTRVSDVHVSWTPDGGVIRFRQKGQLMVRAHIPQNEAQAWMRILKLLAHLDPGRGMMPQDGQLSVRCAGKRYDVRVSTLPTLHGEDAVLRLFDTDRQAATLGGLGFSDPARRLVLQMLGHRSGVILVTGPTGSGKTTTLYALIRQLVEQNLSIVTLEDPVEQHLQHVRQSQVNGRAGYTFSNGLKYLLRQDPDVVMVGEIRDVEGAKMAFDAAYTGHLVLSSLHTDSVQSTFQRLAGFGLDPFLVRYALKGVISQQLVPVPCCQHGCEYCHYVGYKDRQLLTEVLIPPASDTQWTPESATRQGNPGYHAFEEDRRLKEQM